MASSTSGWIGVVAALSIYIRCIFISSELYDIKSRHGYNHQVIMVWSTAPLRFKISPMYVTRELILDMEDKYGVPRHLSMTFEISPPEFNMLRASRKHGRNHDITMFIFRDRNCQEL